MRTESSRLPTPNDGADKGDQYVFIALDSVHKAILSYRVGKRTSENACDFVDDLRERVLNEPQISSDAFPAYRDAIEWAFGSQVHYGQIVKQFPAGVAPPLEPMRPDATHDPTVESVEEPAHVGLMVIKAPTSDHRVDLLDQLPCAHGRSPRSRAAGYGRL